MKKKGKRVVLGTGYAEYYHFPPCDKHGTVSTLTIQDKDIYRENIHGKKIRLIAEIIHDTH